MSPTPSETLATVVCSYGLDPLRLRRALQRIGDRLGVVFGGVIVCNGEHALPVDDGVWQFVRGSNADLDFSAYYEGAGHLQSTTPPSRSVLFLNDSTFTRHNAYRVLKALLVYRPPVENTALPAIAGKTDAYDNVCFENPWSGLPVYVSSFCFLLNTPALDALKNVHRQADADLGSSPMDLSSREWGVRIPMAFREYLKTHLTHTGTSLSWYQLSQHRGNVVLLEKKARCVYSEHRLSGEIGRRGIVFAVYPRMRMKLSFFLFEQVAKINRRLGLRP